MTARRAVQPVAHTVYECSTGGERFVGQRRCPECGLFGRALGLGGGWQRGCSTTNLPVLHYTASRRIGPPSGLMVVATAWTNHPGDSQQQRACHLQAQQAR